MLEKLIDVIRVGFPAFLMALVQWHQNKAAVKVLENKRLKRKLKISEKKNLNIRTPLSTLVKRHKKRIRARR